MIVSIIVGAVFMVMGLVVGLLPDLSHIDPLAGSDTAGFVTMLGYGLYLFPPWLFVLFIGNVVFWLSAQMSWAIIEWVYKKIPGVN